MLIERIEQESIVPAALAPYEACAGHVGATGFYRAFSGAVRDGLHIDRLYLFDAAVRSAPLIAETEPSKPAVTGAAYVSRFLPTDPLHAAIDLARDGPAIVRLTVRPEDIVVPAYRSMLERAGVTERVSFVRSAGRAWRCMTVVRRRESGGFTPGELARLGGLFRLATPLIDRHRVLTGEVSENRAERIGELEARFAARHPALTRRERQICARAAIGISIEGAALDLGIATSSVLTYRKRAYRRLGVNTAYELARLVMR